MKRINSLSDLFMEELAELLNAENQLAQVLPKLASASESLALSYALQHCLEFTKKHISRLQEIFNNIGQNPHKVNGEAMRGLIIESEDIINKTEKSSTRDTSIVSMAQRFQDYGITKYKSVREHAADLGHSKIVELFTKTLNEERAMNFHFNELSQAMINMQVLKPIVFHTSYPEEQGGLS